MNIKIFSENDLKQNICLCWCEKSKEAVLIDAGCSQLDEAEIVKAIKENGLTVKAILLTHGHFDHIISLDRMKAITGAKVYCHSLEKPYLENPDVNLSCMVGKEVSVTADEFLHAGDVISFGEEELQAIHIPGHTPGSLCYYSKKAGVVFTGDTLFANAIGRTDLPLCDSELLMRSIKTKLLTLPEETVVYPGHAASTTIGKEKKHNPFLK